MPIRSAAFHDFGPFADAELPCVEGLNVFMGENGTGKSHAMKAVYAVLETMRNSRVGKVKAIANALETKLAAVFRPDDDAVSRLVRRRQGKASARISVKNVKGAQFAATISARGDVSATKPWGPLRSVFLPTREILSIYPGFVSLYRDREISFDETYYDACSALGLPRYRGPRRELAENLAAQLRAALGGRTKCRAGSRNGARAREARRQGERAAGRARLSSVSSPCDRPGHSGLAGRKREPPTGATR
jgi:hypothetical protein